jgi:hypothetical protein
MIKIAIYVIVVIVLTLLILLLLNEPYIGETFKHLSLMFFKHKNQYTPVPFKKRKIAFLTTEDRDFDYIKLHDQSFEEYCKKYDYEYIRLNNCEKSVATTYWCKVFKVNELLNSGKYDYVVWVDSDTIISNKEVSIDSLISKYGEKDIIIGMDIFFGGLIGLVVYCAGVFLIKNSEIGKNFISDCIKYLKDHKKCIVNNEEKGLWAGICYEQGVMNKLSKEKYDEYTYVDNIYDFIYTPVFWNSTNTSALILHLAGSSNQKRYNIFKNYLE